jgi:type II secretory pathway predicted ATPase ExeA
LTVAEAALPEGTPRLRPEVPYHDLWTKPFRESTEPSFLWLGPPYRDAFAALRAGVLENGGLLLLTGEAGSGKTMLAGALADGLRAEGVRVVKLTCMGHHPDDFRHGVVRALDLPAEPDTRESFLAHLAAFLQGAYARREKVLLVVDEAQNLGGELLDDVEHLARVGREAGRGKVNVLNILLVGQADFEAMLHRRAPRGRADSIGTRVRLRPLRPREVADYVAFRLRVAGADRELFSREAIREIGAASGGIPRLINRIGDCALLGASRRNEGAVTSQVVRAAVSDWGLTVRDGAAGGGDRRAHPRRSVQRVAYAAALILAIGLSAVVYRGANATRVVDDRRPGMPLAGVPTAVDGMPPPAASGPGAPATRLPGAGWADEIAGSVEKRAAPTGDRRATRVPAMSREVARVPEAPAGKPRPGPLRGSADSSEKIGHPEGASAAQTSFPSPPRPGANRSAESDDPAAIIDWLLQRQRAAAER